MTLSAQSTIHDALAQYNDNLSWEGDIAAARLCLEAVRFLLVNRANDQMYGSTRLVYTTLIEQERELKKFVGSQSSNRSSFTRGRAIPQF